MQPRQPKTLEIASPFSSLETAGEAMAIAAAEEDSSWDYTLRDETPRSIPLIEMPPDFELFARNR